jgi:hypothetical protein
MTKKLKTDSASPRVLDSNEVKNLSLEKWTQIFLNIASAESTERKLLESIRKIHTAVSDRQLTGWGFNLTGAPDGKPAIVGFLGTCKDSDAEGLQKRINAAIVEYFAEQGLPAFIPPVN